MKVLALNSSPRTQGESKTELMLSHLAQGMTEAGAQVELIHLRDKKIKTCSGCFSCWTRTPGVCIHKDDMSAELFDKFRTSDMVVYASPLYHYTVNAVMKAFIERTLPMLQPFFVAYKGRTVHPPRYPFPKAVVLSVAGFHEAAIFDAISSWAKVLFGERLVAEIYRPGAENMVGHRVGPRIEGILAATVQAGKEIVQTGKVDEKTMQQVTEQTVKDVAAWRPIGNIFWKTCIAERVTPKMFFEQGLTPRPDSIETFLVIMSMAFNREAAADTRAVIQFVFTGEVQGVCHLGIENGTITGQPGRMENPSMTIETPFALWMDIVTGKADGQKLFMEQKYTVTGDIELLLRFGQLFGK